MKITSEESFRPITIKLETKEEVDLMGMILFMRIDLDKYVVGRHAQEEFLALRRELYTAFSKVRSVYV